MDDSTFDRETLLDITVNVVPMLILLFFVVLFTVWTPWEGQPLIYAISHFLTIFPLLVLALLTWVAAHYI
ncbi:DUF6684 family protein [Haladaptatus salinisoli]|uniref:DUF6684 family protein n=1 Tax=Haladaptatus salinisoli TaxID=2884876 RepID=UPI001D0A585D|nr:DUF6684 family protein [Haladaptatus salinisoli]